MLNRRDRDHDRVRIVLLADRGPYLVPAGILSELTYLLERTMRLEVLEAFLMDLETGGYTLECGEGICRAYARSCAGTLICRWASPTPRRSRARSAMADEC